MNIRRDGVALRSPPTGHVRRTCSYVGIPMPEAEVANHRTTERGDVRHRSRSFMTRIEGRKRYVEVACIAQAMQVANIGAPCETHGQASADYALEDVLAHWLAFACKESLEHHSYLDVLFIGNNLNPAPILGTRRSAGATTTGRVVKARVLCA